MGEIHRHSISRWKRPATLRETSPAPTPELRNAGKRVSDRLPRRIGRAELAQEAKARAGNEAAMFPEGPLRLLAALRLSATEAETGRASSSGRALSTRPQSRDGRALAQVAQILAQFLSERKRRRRPCAISYSRASRPPAGVARRIGRAGSPPRRAHTPVPCRTLEEPQRPRGAVRASTATKPARAPQAAASRGA
jgi:hypothetical protein